jgi:hypothetical protein
VRYEDKSKKRGLVFGIISREERKKKLTKGKKKSGDDLNPPLTKHPPCGKM